MVSGKDDMLSSARSEHSFCLSTIFETLLQHTKQANLFQDQLSDITMEEQSVEEITELLM
jgi:hypothetical protein